MRKRDYSTKRYKNPFFARKDHSKRKRVFYWLLFLVILGTIIYILFYSKFFTIKNIEVSGNTNINAAEVINIINKQLQKRRFLFFKQSNIFLVNKSKIEKRILENYVLDKIKIRRKFPDTIKIELFEKLSSIVWLTGEQAYYVDLQGIASSHVNNQQINQAQDGQVDVLRHKIIAQNLPLVYDLESRGVAIGERVASQKVIDFIIKLVENLEKLINYEIAYYNFNARSREVEAVTTEGWQIKFSIDADLNSQLDNLMLLLQEKIKNPRDLDYIDLRFGERVFYR
jgi:cell division septal protein FtsQ